MAMYRETVEYEWDECKDCPLVEGLYRPDGFGMRDELYGYKCKKGCFEFKRRKPNYIPVHCPFSEYYKQIETLEDLLELSEEEVLGFIQYKKGTFDDER